MKKGRYKKSFFIKIFGVFLASLIPIYILAYGIYQWGHSIAANEIRQSLETRAAFFMKTLENEIVRIRQMQYECLNDAGLFYYVNAAQIMTEFERIQALLAIKDRIDLMRNSSGYIRNVAVYIPHMDRLISSLGGVDHITDDWLRIGQAKADLSMAGIVYLDDRMYLSAAYPSMPVNPKAQSRYALIIELSVPDIRDLLMSFNMYPQGGALLASVSYDYQIVAGDDIGLSELIEPDSAIKARYMVAGSFSEYLNMHLYTYVSQQLIYGPLERYNVLFLLFSAVAVIVVMVFLFSTHILVNKPLKLLVHSLKKMEEGDFKIRIESHANDEFDYLYRAFNNMAASLENLIELNYRSRMLKQKAELKQLQAQINPHFLYNSFFILYCMAKDRDYENITLFLSYLSDYYRYITRNVLDDVMLKDEVEHARRYAQIQLMRFKRRMEIDFGEPGESYERIRVPHLILQPLLENAFNHGLKDVPSGGLLRVSFVPEGETLVIRVADNGKGISPDERERLLNAMDSAEDPAELSALINIHRRLRLKFGRAYGLSIEDTAAPPATGGDTGGATLELRIPGV